MVVRLLVWLGSFLVYLVGLVLVCILVTCNGAWGYEL